jgi:predicted Zn-dependent protease
MKTAMNERYIETLAEQCIKTLMAVEELTLNFSGEDQTYVRFNGGHIRQSTSVQQNRVSITFQQSKRRVIFGIDLTGELTSDVALCLSLIERARQEVNILPEDPYCSPIEVSDQSGESHKGEIPQLEDQLADIAKASSHADLAGLLATGRQYRAIRNSKGASHWFENESFFFDYSLYTVNDQGDNKAIKSLYAGREWNSDALSDQIQDNIHQLAQLRQANRTLLPGSYRVFLGPSAVAALVQMFSWGAVSYGAWRRGNSALKKLIEGEMSLSPLFSLTEDFSGGLVPRFNSLGEVANESLPIIEKGRLKQLLTSTRSSREYAVPANGAESSEGLRSPVMDSGTLERPDYMKRLGTGLYINNLHYLNWSDLQSARITGMTRYACFWVENGDIVAPIKDLRFDESLFRVFGSELEAVTHEQRTVMNTDTYGQRSLGGCKVPGILVKDFKFTL